MRNKLSKIALAASILFALAFTLSCSDDKDSWLSCEAAGTLANKCDAEAYSTLNCNDDACWDAADAKWEKCMIDGGACGGASVEKCYEHYAKECGEY